VRRRLRAAGFLAFALAAAALAAAIANGYSSQALRGYGALRPVVVAARALPAGGVLRPEDVVAALRVRRVPARFVPAGTLAAPEQALGLAPIVPIVPGAYLTGAQLRPPREDATRPELGPRRHPVEIAVSGAEALLAGEAGGRRATVDVVVTTEPRGAGPGRTYVAAAAVPLLAIGPGADGPGPGGTSAATLALTKPQALHLIAAESYARKLTLLPRG